MDNRGYAGTTESRKLASLCYAKTTRQLVNETTSGAAAGNMDLRNYGFTELRKLTSLCYAGQQTTDNGQRRAMPAHCSLLKAHNSLPKNITTLQHYILRTTDNGQRRAMPAHCSRLKAQGSRLTTFLYLLYTSIHSIPFDFYL